MITNNTEILLHIAYKIITTQTNTLTGPIKTSLQTILYGI